MVQHLINFSKRLQKEVSGLAQPTNTQIQALTPTDIFLFPGNVPKNMHAYIYSDIYLLCIMCFPRIPSLQPDLLLSRSWDFRVKVYKYTHPIWMYTFIEISGTGDTCASLPSQMHGAALPQGVWESITVLLRQETGYWGTTTCQRAARSGCHHLIFT